MTNQQCPYTTVRKIESKTIFINCRACEQGSSTIFDETCRSNIFHILEQEYGADQLVLNHALVKVFSGDALVVMKEIIRFIDGVKSLQNVSRPSCNSIQCHEAVERLTQQLRTILTRVYIDPIHVFFQLHSLCTKKECIGSFCQSCQELYTNVFSEILAKAEFASRISIDMKSSDSCYVNLMRPYVRPGFVDSYIHLEPPADTVFVESYEVLRKGGRPMTVSLYTLRSRPEKLYFVVPPEYDLPLEELLVLEKVRTFLSHHRPKDASFLDSETARDYFQRFAREIISQIIQKDHYTLSLGRVEYLADIFARYTAGFGILEDLLLDERIQDIYVNAPVVDNPLHLVLNGEEYTSNIYLSVGDVEALASRFRTLSHRAFSEASPVLDMDLEGYHTRVAAISNPLTPRGIAFALRRHRQKPWTLTHFIKNNMISPVAAGVLSFLVDGQASLLVAGSRGAGKTSLLSALMLEIPQRFRILTIEDTSEIPVDQLQHLGYKIQSLLTRSISAGASSNEVDPTDALRTALRLGESILVLGEVRGVEAKVLFEAMRIGAAGNLIMGTIHGSTTRDVYERVVYDIGVPPTSFKAVDVVVIAAPIRAEGGVERKRRVIQISEITKTGWTINPDPDNVFQDLMTYNTKQDSLDPTSVLDMGQSQVLRHIASKWGVTIEKILQNIKLRTEIKKTIVEQSTTNPELLEAPANRDANNAFWMLLEENKQRNNQVDYDEVYERWMTWFTRYMGRGS